MKLCTLYQFGASGSEIDKVKTQFRKYKTEFYRISNQFSKFHQIDFFMSNSLSLVLNWPGKGIVYVVIMYCIC